MGTCCAWLMGSQENEEMTEKSCLLSTFHTTNQPHVLTTQSARLHRLSDSDTENEFLSSVEKLQEAEMKYISITSLDKTFQDHAKLYNDVFNSFKMMNSDLHKFKAIFAADTAGIPMLDKCVTCLVSRCVGAKLEVGRSQNRVTISFDAKEVSRCASDLPEDLLEALQLFNSVNKHIQEVMNHSPHVETSISILLKDEQNMRNDVFKAEFHESEGPNCLKACVENLKQLKIMSSNLPVITRYAEKLFKDMVVASKGFFKEDGNNVYN